MQMTRSNSPKKPNLLLIHNHNEAEWFSQFQQLEDPLAQLLLLVAVLSDQNMVGIKEATQFKQYVLNNTEAKNGEIVVVFMRTGSIYNFRSEMRGHLGLPRMRCNDAFNRKKSRRSTSPVSCSPNM